MEGPIALVARCLPGQSSVDALPCGIANGSCSAPVIKLRWRWCHWTERYLALDRVICAAMPCLPACLAVICFIRRRPCGIAFPVQGNYMAHVECTKTHSFPLTPRGQPPPFALAGIGGGGTPSDWSRSSGCSSLPSNRIGTLVVGGRLP